MCHTYSIFGWSYANFTNSVGSNPKDLLPPSAIDRRVRSEQQDQGKRHFPHDTLNTYSHTHQPAFLLASDGKPATLLTSGGRPRGITNA